MSKPYHKKLEIWSGDIITITDYSEQTNEPLDGVLISTHDAKNEPNFKTGFENTFVVYIEKTDIQKVITALQEFVYDE